MVHNPASCKN